MQQHKPMNTAQHTNMIKDKNLMIVSIREEKNFEKIHHLS
jgi:hypothetical protein